MLNKVFSSFLLAAATLVSVSSPWAAPQSFEQAKVAARQNVYADRTQSDLGTLYCGCSWRWTGRSGGRVDLPSCGYEIRKNEVRANRIEWEHIVPAWTFGHQRQCWQNGGRKNCKTSDPVFRVMEADLHNLSPVIGEVNADRSNYNFGMVSQNMPNQYGACSTRTGFKQRITEPRDRVKGLVARVTFYMYDRYGLSMSRQQQRVLMAWNKQYPVDEWELERDRRIAAEMGHSNPFVTGQKTWSLGHKPSREGVDNMPVSSGPPESAGVVTSKPAPVEHAKIIGNKNSGVYHLPEGCPSYDKVAEHNRVPFDSERDAQEAGFRKAGNCRE